VVARDPSGDYKVVCSGGAGGMFIQWVKPFSLMEAICLKANFDKEMANRLGVPEQGLGYFRLRVERLVVESLFEHLCPNERRTFCTIVMVSPKI
jgi:hypothetical protein